MGERKNVTGCPNIAFVKKVNVKILKVCLRTISEEVIFV